MQEQPKEPVMRENPFDVARMEQAADMQESTSDVQQKSMAESSSGSSLRLKLKDD